MGKDYKYYTEDRDEDWGSTRKNNRQWVGRDYSDNSIVFKVCGDAYRTYPNLNGYCLNDVYEVARAGISTPGKFRPNRYYRNFNVPCRKIGTNYYVDELEELLKYASYLTKATQYHPRNIE